MPRRPTPPTASLPASRRPTERVAARGWRLLRLLLVACSTLALTPPALADEAARCDTGHCRRDEQHASDDDLAGARDRVDQLVDQLAPLSTPTLEPRTLTLEADQLTLQGAADTLSLTATGATLTVEGLTLRAVSLELSPDGSLVAEQIALYVEDAAEPLASAQRLERDEAGRVRLDALVVHDGARSLSVASLERTADGRVVATETTVDVCDCPDDDDGLLRPRVHVGRASTSDDLDASDGTVELHDLEVELAGLSWPLPTGTVHDDLRATGLLWPRLGYNTALGFLAELPVFWRLGRHADLTTALGWATEAGPTFGLRWRHHLDRFTRGEIAFSGRYHIDDEFLDGEVRGTATATWLGRLRLLTRLDWLTRPSLHIERTGGLWDRARRAARSSLSLGWDGDQVAFFLTDDVLQGRPRRPQLLSPDERDALFPARIPAVHRVPTLGLGLLTWPLAMTRFDLDARYTHTASFEGPGWVELPGGDPELGLLGSTPSAVVGDGVFDAGQDLINAVHHIRLRGGLEVPISLGGYGSLRPAIALTQRYDVADQVDEGTTAFARHTAFDAALELSTTLVAAGDGWSHLLRPWVAWRARLFEGHSDRLLAPTVTGIRRRGGAPHALETGLRAVWTGQDWRVDGALTGVAMFDIHDNRALGGATDCPADVCALGLLETDLSLFDDDFVALGLMLEVPATHPDSPSAYAELEVGPRWLRGRLSELHTEGALWSVGQPAATQPAGPWRAPRRVRTAQTTAEPSAVLLGALLGERSEDARQVVDVTELGLSTSFVGVTASAALALIHKPDFGLESRGALGYTGDCGCWNVGVALERHATAPHWDVMATVELLTGSPGADDAFYAPRIRPGDAF